MCRAQTPPSRVRLTMAIQREAVHTVPRIEEQDPDKSQGTPFTHTDILKRERLSEQSNAKRKTIPEPASHVMLLPKISMDEIKKTIKESATGRQKVETKDHSATKAPHPRSKTETQTQFLIKNSSIRGQHKKRRRHRRFTERRR